MSEQDASIAAPPPAVPNGASPQRSFEDVFGAPPAGAAAPAAAAPAAAGGRSFEDVFGPPPAEAAPSLLGKISHLIPSPLEMFAPDDPDKFINWKDYETRAPAGRIMAAFGSPFNTNTQLADETVDWLKKNGSYTEDQAQRDDEAKTWAGAFMRPAINAMRGLNEALTRPLVQIAANAVDYGIVRPFESLLAGTYQIFKEAQQTALGKIVGAEQLGADIAGEFEREGTVGDLGAAHTVSLPGEQLRPRAPPELPGVVNRYLAFGNIDRAPFSDSERAIYGDVDHEPLPEAIARGRANAVTNEGDAGYMGTREPTEADLAARRAAAAEIPPHPHDPWGVNAETTRVAADQEVSPQTPPVPTVESVARQVNPAVMGEYDRLTAQQADLGRWLRELPEQTAANIEAKPPAELQEIDRQIADIERKAENAGARRQKQYADQLDDLHDQRADMVDDFVRNHGDMKTVREAAEKVRTRLGEIAPDVNAAYAEARERVPETQEATGPVTAEAAPEPVSTEQPQGPPAPAAVEPPPTPEQATTAETATPQAEPVSRETQKPQPVTEAQQVQGIADHMQARLVAVGRSAEQAKAEASVVAAYWQTWADRLGGKLGSAREMYDKYQPPVRKGRQYAEKAKEGAEVGQSAHGKTTFYPDGRRIVTMFKTANASTFMHEMGHVWLDDLLRFAEHPDAPADVKADAKTVLDWLGAKDASEVRETTKGGNFTARATKKHETFARTAERYLMEGRAPTRALQKVFDQFKEWLTAIYKSVDKLKSPINDEIRNVFDRILGRTPDRTLITGEHVPRENIADIHEADAETTPAAQAEPVSNRIHTEFATEVRGKAPEGEPNVRIEPPAAPGVEPNAGAETGEGEAQRPGTDGAVAAAEPHAGTTGHVQEPGAVVPGGSEASAERTGRPEGAKKSGLYLKVPKEPTRLITFLKKLGGLKGDRGDVKAIFGGNRKATKGLLNDARGKAIEDATVSAWEAGYFPDYPAPGAHGLIEDEGRGRPDPDVLIAAIKKDTTTPQYSQFDADKVVDYEHALDHNHEVDRIARELGINEKDMPQAEFWDRVAEHMSVEQQAREIESMSEARADDREEAEGIINDHEPETPESTEPTGAGHGVGAGGAEGPGGAAGGEGTGQERTGQGQRPDRTAGSATAGGAESRPSAATTGSAAEQPVGAHEKFEPGEERFLDKSANFRMENINSPEDVKDAIREANARNQDFVEQRRGIMTHEETLRLADAMGLSPRDLDNRAIGQAFNAEQIIALEKLFIQSATDVSTVAKAAKAAGMTDESLIALGAAESRQRMILDYVQGHASGVRAESGRALNAYNAIKKLVGHAEAHAVAEILKNSGGADLYQLRARAEAYAALDSPSKIAGAITEMNKPSFGDMGLEVFKNWLISGPLTHMGYSAGNEFLALYKAIPETAFEAGAGAVREFLTGQKVPRAHFGEIMPQLYAMYYGQRDGWRAAWDAMQAGQTTLLPHEALDYMTKSQRARYDEAMSMKGATYEDALKKAGIEINASTPFTNTKAVPNFKIGNIPIPLGSIVRGPGERMVAPIHSYFRTIGYLQSIARQSARMAIEEGLTGTARGNRIAELSLRPSEEMMKIARDEANQQTLMGTGAGFTQKVSAVVNHNVNLPVVGNIKPLAFVDPFVRVQSNIVEQGALQRGPLGIASKQIRDDLMGRNGPLAQTTATGKIVLGTSLMAVYAGMELEGSLLPSAPSDPKQAAATLMVDGLPHSVRIGDFSFEVSRFGPMGWQMGLAADFSHAIRTGAAMPKDQAEHIASLLTLAFAHNFVEEGAMRGPSDLIKSMSNPEGYGSNYVRKLLATATVPFSVGMSQVARQVDPYSRVARGFMEEVKSKVPFWSKSLYPSRDTWGEPVPNRDWAGMYLKRVQEDPVNRELLRMGIWPAKPINKIRGVELTEQQYDDYANLAGHLAKDSLDKLMASPSWPGKPGHIKFDQIKQRVLDARERAQNLIMASSRGTPNDIHAQALQNKADLASGRDQADNWEP